MNVHTAKLEQFSPTSLEKPVEHYLTRRERKQQKKKKTPSQMDILPGYRPLVGKTDTQREYIDVLKETSQVFAIGPAGTGKTYIPARIAAKMLSQKRIDKIYVARPTVSHKRHQQGFLPGKLEQKLAPWLVPLLDAFKDEVSGTTLDKWMIEKKVEFLSFEHMRGRTFKDCFVILDEAQNCTIGDLKLFLTRKGENSVYVVTGDIDQVDIEDSGLETIIDMIEKQDLSPDIIEFSQDEVVRSEDAKEWVKAFSLVSH